jgi:tRNA uridine 5-carboxymethylaminomethyl modification enzyme
MTAENLARLERARVLAARHGRPANDIALAYLLSQPFPVYALVGCQTVEQVQASCAAADLRLTPSGIKLGLVGAERSKIFRDREIAIARGLELARSLTMTPAEARRHGFKVNQDGRPRTALELIGATSVGFANVTTVWPQLRDLRSDVIEALESEALYAGYLPKQDQDIAALRKEEQTRLPDWLDYRSMPNLSAELRQKLDRIRPSTLGQASRIDGMTPAALAVVLSHLKRRNCPSAA